MVKGGMIALGILIGAFIVGFFAYLFILMAGDYVIDDKDLVFRSASTLVDQKGDPITSIYSENRELVPISQIPKHVQEAFISVEDARFYQHHGIDPRAIGRAVYRDILTGGKAQGASTITQQLAKNVFLTHEKSWLRKTKEAIIAINLERKYSKDKILEMYLNQIYFGHGAYGIQAAAKTYFHKDVSQLTLEEGATLAGLPKAPSNYSPIEHPEASRERRDLVLDLMEKYKYITPNEAVRAKGRTLVVRVYQEKKNPAYLTYIDMVMDEARTKYHLSRTELLNGGYKIVVPMNPLAQKAVYNSFQNNSYFVGTGKEKPEGAMVLMDGKTGGIIAAQGGRNYVTEGLNRVMEKRQPGSAFKPVAVYGPALKTNEYKPYSMLKDEPMNFNGYQPKNYDGKYKGNISMMEAITYSTNLPAVWLLNQIGIPTAKASLSELGMPIQDQQLGLALGGLDQGVTPLQMTAAYRSFQQGGKVIQPFTILKIYDQNGTLVGQASTKEKTVWSPQNAWYMTRMLQQVIKKGTGSMGQSNMEIAGKTGTTNFGTSSNANKDAWFVGYTPDLVGAVWMGYDKTTMNQYLNSGSGKPTLLFKHVVNQLPFERGLTFKKPKGIKDLEPPIEMAQIRDLSAGISFGSYGMPVIKLTWTPSSDKRLQYQIFTTKNGISKQIDTVTGKGEYEASGKYLFSLPDFYVVPVDPQTNQPGTPSNVVSIKLFPGFGSSSDNSNMNSGNADGTAINVTNVSETKGRGDKGHPGKHDHGHGHGKGHGHDH